MVNLQPGSDPSLMRLECTLSVQASSKIKAGRLVGWSGSGRKAGLQLREASHHLDMHHCWVTVSVILEQAAMQ